MGDGSNTNQNSGSGKHETFEQRGTNVPTQPTVPKMPVKFFLAYMVALGCEL